MKKECPLSAYEADDEIGHYVIVKVLSRSVLGATYLCRHAISDKRVIVKTFPAGLESDPGFEQRFEIIREQLTTLVHPNILVTRTMGLFEGEPYAVIDLLEGSHAGTVPTLQERLDCGEALPERFVLRLVLQIAGALAFAHNFRGGIIHCNFKPANILFDGSGQPRISEFGLLNLIGPHKLKCFMNEIADEVTVSDRFAQAGALPCVKAWFDIYARSSGGSLWCEALAETLLYMSPEQRAGLPATPQSNIYSLGLILYRMLTGREYRTEGSPSPSAFGVRRFWDDVIVRSTAQDPALRYHSVQEMIDALYRGAGQYSRMWTAGALLLGVAAAGAVWLGSASSGEYTQTLEPEARDCESADQEQFEGFPTLTGRWKAVDPEMSFAPIPPTVVELGDGQKRVRIKLTHPGWMGVTEVTQAQFLNVTGEDPSLYRDKAGKLPVARVTWFEAVHFCEELTHRERSANRLPPELVYRLPTEAEWVAGLLSAQTAGQYGKRYKASPNGWDRLNSGGRPRKGGTLSANPWGFRDMSGNVKEWCYSRFEPIGAAGGVQTQSEPGDEVRGLRVVRGGSFRSDRAGVADVPREGFAEDTRSEEIGFRVFLGYPLSGKLD